MTTLGPSLNAPFIRAARTHYVYTTQKVVRKVRPTQKDRVLAQLRDGPTCGTEFLDMHIPRFGGRIMELREEGHTITNENCWKHQHFSRQTIYRLRKGGRNETAR